MRNRIILFIIIVLIFLIKLNLATAVTVTVCTSGCNYTAIQGAIYNASSGDVINVLNGTYTENITVNASVTLNATPYISLTGGFNVSASSVTIKGFNITEGIKLDQSGLAGSYKIGILINDSNNNIIYNNYFTNITGVNGTDGDSDYIRGGIAVLVVLFI